MRALAASLLALVLTAGCGEEAADKPQRPKGPPADFTGIYSDDVFFRDAAYKHRTLARQHAVGVRLIRQPFAWNEFEANPQRFDEFVRSASRAGIRVLPVLLGPEPGVEPPEAGMRPPRDPAAFARFAAAVARRYGPGGSFDHELPIRSWQIWNEPNIPSFWATGPDPTEYAKLLRAAASAIRRVDGKAEIVAAGLPDSRLGEPAARFLAKVLEQDVDVDTVAVHPYAETPAQVVARVRAVRRTAGADTDVWVTEVGWGTGGREGVLRVDPATQARHVTETFRRLRREPRVRGIVWFQWRDPDPFPGRRPIWPYFAGLLEADGSPKPALAAFERAAKG